MSETMHPGGLSLTEHALRLVCLKTGSRIIDVGCGSGATVALLRKRGHEAYGIDIEPHSDSQSELIIADAELMPFPDCDMDAVFFECSLSKIGSPSKAIAEAHRILVHGGTLVVSDIFTKGVSNSFSGLLGRLEQWADIKNRIENCGFKLSAFEEYGDALVSFWGQLVFDYGLEEAAKLMCGCQDALKSPDNSYFLAVFKKE